MDAETERMRLGVRLRTLRKSRGLTLENVASRADITTSALSQVERGLSGITIETLVRISAALEVSTGSLFAEDEWHAQPLREADRVSLAGDCGHIEEVLNRKPGTRFEVFETRIMPGGRDAPEPYRHGDSEEMLVVLDGVIELYLGGKVHMLGQGDTIEFQTSIPHLISNPGRGEVRGLWIISPPTSGRKSAHRSDSSR